MDAELYEVEFTVKVQVIAPSESRAGEIALAAGKTQKMGGIFRKSEWSMKPARLLGNAVDLSS